MKHLFTLSLAAAAAIAALLAGPAFGAGNVQKMLQSNGCTGCHAEKTKVVGPAWGWVAYHYKGKKGAVDSVADFIITGGVGYWKALTNGIPMPSHHNLSKAQAKEIAKWILAQPPVKPPKP
ncbi:MAG: c-type cytochrome [Gammaproteobacteria bacterium]